MGINEKLLPKCFGCNKVIDDEQYVDLTDYGDYRYTYHRQCMKENDYELVKDFWDDEIEKEFLAFTSKYAEEKEEKLKGWIQ